MATEKKKTKSKTKRKVSSGVAHIISSFNKVIFPKISEDL